MERQDMDTAAHAPAQRGVGPARTHAAEQLSGSGDSGAFACIYSGSNAQNLMDPAAQPWVSGVGGTSLEPSSLCYAIRADQPVRGWFEVGGTSLSGPVWAAIIADRDSYQGHRSGNINPWVYALLDTDPGR